MVPPPRQTNPPDTGSANTKKSLATSSTASGPSRARRSTSSIRRTAKCSRVTQGTKADVDAAVAAARAALPGWQALDGHARARYLYALARGIQKHSRLFA